MGLAPEPFHAACMAVIHRAILHARALAWGMPPAGTGPEVEIADLMHAIHNIPSLIQHWEQCDQNWLRSSLEAYDEKYGTDGAQLLRVYEEVVSGRAT